MAEPTLQELKELILNLDKKIDTGFIRLEGEIKRVEEKLEGEIKRVEEKLEAKIDGLEKRLSNEETLSRTAFAALVVGALAGLIKYLFFPNP
ncbi:conserved hypothetical protein [Gloeothece citriformis PCC 7424]|uniref:DUF4164 domain-containing protein n=1 Tax=Gloeothece citriformis (strain PCC 7424) TaxID=65393 RepID=B7KKP3_GLOC7|nr:hypothetical protein [Gloeothece citriformis]ACK71012.1 conserved hypothetical protein [Gloeothece citriformis PCC 7424]